VRIFAISNVFRIDFAIVLHCRSTGLEILLWASKSHGPTVQGIEFVRQNALEKGINVIS